MSEPRHDVQVAAGVAWALAVIVGGAWLASFADGARLDSDLLSLLPTTDDDPVAERALDRLSSDAAGEVVLLVRAPTWEATATAADAAAGALAIAGVRVEGDAEVDPDVAGALGAGRAGLVTRADRVRLASMTDAEVADEAYAALTMPVGAGVLPWTEDPLGLFTSFLLDRAGSTPLQPREGRLVVEEGATTWVALRARAASTALDEADRLAAAVRAASDAARRSTPGVEVRRSGVPLFAAASAEAARGELSRIGLGSLACVLALMLAAFRSLRPLLLVVASIGVGCLAGLVACTLLFDRVHVLTLVFGSTLVGVAEDYGIHWFASRQARPRWARGVLLRHLAPGLLTALATSVAAYAVLAWTPFPVLRQMAVFSTAGLLGAFATVAA